MIEVRYTINDSRTFVEVNKANLKCKAKLFLQLFHYCDLYLQLLHYCDLFLQLFQCVWFYREDYKETLI